MQIERLMNRLPIIIVVGCLLVSTTLTSAPASAQLTNLPGLAPASQKNDNEKVSEQKTTDLSEKTNSAPAEGGISAELTSEWARIFGAAATYIEAGQAIAAETELYIELLRDVVESAEALKVSAATIVTEQQPLLDALPPPAADATEQEPPQVAKLRGNLTARLDKAKSNVASADLVIVRANQLTASVAGIERQVLATQIKQRQETPWSFAALGKGVSEFSAAILAVASTPETWRKSLNPDQRTAFAATNLQTLFGILIGAVLIGALVRIFLGRRLGYHSFSGHVTQARRLGAAVVRAVADGLIPVSVIAILYYWSIDALAGIGDPKLANVITGGTMGLMIVILAYAGLSAALTPNYPAWRLVPLTNESSRAVRKRGTFFAFVVAADLFLWTALDGQAKSSEFMTIYAIVTCGLRALAILPLLRSRLWRLVDETVPTNAPADVSTDQPVKKRSTFWAIARMVVGLATISAIIAGGLGYADLALFMARALSWTLVIVGAVFLLRGAAREAIQAFMNSPAIRTWLGVGPDGTDTLTYWCQALLEPVFLIVAAILTAPFWGFSQHEMLAFGGELLQGFKVGDVTISLTGIGAAILTFIAILVVTRALQRTLLNSLLPRTRIDIGAQHSLATGFGYIGIILAAIISVSALGIDLSNLAIVAGALSVGIGFGLQSIVSNFVSGLILLIERPIKVGDWIIVGDQQGIVKRISIRATEFETFDRASVIIPNSELITNAVINRTHKDTHGRVEVPIGVAYGTDTRKVETILAEIAIGHPEVLSIPEPFIVFKGFGDSSLDFEVRCYTANNLRGLRISTALRHEIHERFEAEGIEIPFPQRVIHMAEREKADPTPMGVKLVETQSG
jgi:potassium efflux system protein